jgi:hypothetical protein
VLGRHIKAILLLAGEEFSPERIVTPSKIPFKIAGTIAATITVTLFSSVLSAQSIPGNTPIYALAKSEGLSKATLTGSTANTKDLNFNKPSAEQALMIPCRSPEIGSPT